MELMKMRSFPTNVSLTILTEKLTSQGMDGTQGNSGIGGVCPGTSQRHGD